MKGQHKNGYFKLSDFFSPFQISAVRREMNKNQIRFITSPNRPERGEMGESKVLLH